MFAINAVNYLDRLIVVAVGPALKADFHLLDSQIGILSSAFILVYASPRCPAGCSPTASPVPVSSRLAWRCGA